MLKLRLVVFLTLLAVSVNSPLNAQRERKLVSTEVFGMFLTLFSTKAYSSAELDELFRKYGFVRRSDITSTFEDSNGRIVIDAFAGKSAFLRFIPAAASTIPQAVLSALIEKGTGLSVDTADTLELSFPERTMSNGTLRRDWLTFSLGGSWVRTTVNVEWSNTR